MLGTSAGAIGRKKSLNHGLISFEGYIVPGSHNRGAVDFDNGKIARVTNQYSIWLRSSDEHVKDICIAEEYNAALDARKADTRISQSTQCKESEMRKHTESFRDGSHTSNG